MMKKTLLAVFMIFMVFPDQVTGETIDIGVSLSLTGK